jgi:GNAT superfamily N-acetyltransferase
VTEPAPAIEYRCTGDLPTEALLHLYRANGWSAAEKPTELTAALRHSHSVVTAWDGDLLVGLANAISDGHLVVYYPHLLVLPEYRGRGIGSRLLGLLQEPYAGVHQQVILSDRQAVGFYQKHGFVPAGSTQALWIYAGSDHD